jgi:chaperonin cofactor prefoldin
MEKLKKDLEIKKKALRQAQDEMEKNKEELKKINKEYVLFKNWGKAFAYGYHHIRYKSLSS